MVTFIGIDRQRKLVAKLEGVEAAGNCGLDAAWPHIVELVHDARSPKPL